MGLIDSIKNAFDGDDSNDSSLVNKAKDVVNAQEDKIDAGVEKAGDFIDEKTGGKFEAQVDQGQSFIQDKTGNL
ncbi:antitoxin [Propionibacteriaceae bacterium Y1923]|uniref:antitoxin n=1 Tax=Aestuariimicrobium sp. Y1814 TaxID=3418742 RepID=UPI003C17221E